MKMNGGGTTSGGASSAIPEPETVTLFALGTMMVLLRRNRNK